jgi:2'-5' RNA ligase
VSGSDVGRLFVAVIPPPSAIAALLELPRAQLPGTRWTHPEQWHVTLRFLGRASIRAAGHALESLEAEPATASVGPEVIRLGARIAAMPVGGLDPLAEGVSQAMSEVAESPPDHEFMGHLTLARSRSQVPLEALGARLDIAFEVAEVHLVQRRLSEAGPRYELLSARHLVEETD